MRKIAFHMAGGGWIEVPCGVWVGPGWDETKTCRGRFTGLGQGCLMPRACLCLRLSAHGGLSQSAHLGSRNSIS
jgi:hypothetical protein